MNKERGMDPEKLQRILSLSAQPYRPPQIVKLSTEIEAQTRVLELRNSISGDVTKEEISEVVKMKLELDCLYALWAEGKIE